MKKTCRAFIVLLIAFIVPCTATLAQKSPTSNAKSDVQFLPLEEVRVGQKGIARTVFTGAEPQDFGVEILGVVPGYPSPRQSMIIARLSGEQVQRTSVFAGMSGSPVYIDGKLVGAIAFSFPFSK
ncbi:MAG TPA: SpoIVB peptidase S55 domain-containing protein, partial [Pyrinomonadaceae bacterium]|nr:SpoIVB peptidase S55 domain-containing protein [Pyrinomonadaceae bacterium]